MATKGKGKILDGQIAFEFLGEIETEIKPKKSRLNNIENKVKEKVQTKFRKQIVNIKHEHFKRARKIRRIPRKLIRRDYDNR